MSKRGVAHTGSGAPAGLPRLRPSLLLLSAPARLILAAGIALIAWAALLLALA